MQAVFVGGSALFFLAYVLVAEAFGILSSGITVTAITAPSAPDRGGILGGIDAVIQALTYAFDLMSRFFQLLLFQAPGLEGASLITLLIFTPLTFINGWIIFRGLRG